jgi:hypothetical protein
LLRAGPLSLIYEAGEIRYIKLGDREILRRIYLSVRDHNWATILPEVSNLDAQVSDDAFRISFDAQHKMGCVDFFWKGTVLGDAAGTITFSMNGLVRSTFRRHRIGLCVLHPIRECAGNPAVIERPDGTEVGGNFPFYVSPSQPFLEIQAIRHEVAPGVWAEVRFKGEVFEMEDQRNWTDGSYKTYCPSLSLPSPVEVRKGERISQSVTITLKGSRLNMQTGRHSSRISFSVGSQTSTDLPQIGVGFAPDADALSPRQCARLRVLNLSHVRVELNLSLPDYRVVLQKAWAEASVLGLRLEIALTISDNAEEELESLLPTLNELKPDVGAWLIFHISELSTKGRWLKIARSNLLRYIPGAVIGGGTNAYFAELNRSRPPLEYLDLVCFSINPQVHSRDNASMVEALEAQASTVASAKQWTRGLPIAVSPITLKPRFNPYAKGDDSGIPPNTLPSSVDPRQSSLFGAGWTLGSLKYLSESGAHSLTYYETQGWRGVMETENGSPLPEAFHSIPGCVFPVYHVLADVNELKGGKIVPSKSSDNLRVDGLVLHKDGLTRIMVANLTESPQSVALQGVTGRVCVRQLNNSNAEEAMRSPEEHRAAAGDSVETVSGSLDLDLLPYAIVRVDTEAENSPWSWHKKAGPITVI